MRSAAAGPVPRWRRLGIGGVVVAALVATATPGAATGGGDRAGSGCPAPPGVRLSPETGRPDPRGTLRVVGIQYHQQVADVASYASYAHRMDCLVRRYVLPLRRAHEALLVVFNEDIGLETLALGARGAAARALATSALRAPARDTGPAPAGAVAALGTLAAAYAPQIAAYQARFGPLDPRKALFLAATDTFARAFSATFSGLALRYGIYVVAANNQARYTEVHDPAQVAQFADPALLPRATSAFVASTAHVPNTTFLWGPRTLRPGAPPGERNLLARTEKVPLTSFEATVLALDSGPATGAAALANAAGAVVGGHHLGFATSLPAFAWGYPYGHRPRDFRPCADLSTSYASCLDALGVDVLIQAEANPGRWAGTGGGGRFQPVEWLESSTRAVTDPTLRIAYAVNPMMVGNLLDLAFDGQSAVLARAGGAAPRHYVGAGGYHPEDGDVPADRALLGGSDRYWALAPWVTPDTGRAALRAVGAALAPGSGDPRENAYLETAVWADLPPAGR